MGVSEKDLVRWNAIEATATRGPWEWHTSNSWRRLVSYDHLGRNRMVIDPFTSRADGHPNLAVSQEDMEFVVMAREALPKLIAEVNRLRNVIKTGGAMYRAERAALGIPGGFDPRPNIPLREVFDLPCSKCHKRYGDHIVKIDEGMMCPG